MDRERRVHVPTAEAGVAMQTVIVRRDVAAAIGFDERIPFADDYDFLVRLAFVSPGCVVDEVVADVREHAGRTTRQRYDQTLGMAMTYRGAESLFVAYWCVSALWLLVRVFTRWREISALRKLDGRGSAEAILTVYARPPDEVDVRT